MSDMEFDGEGYALLMIWRILDMAGIVHQEPYGPFESFDNLSGLNAGEI